MKKIFIILFICTLTEIIHAGGPPHGRGRNKELARQMQQLVQQRVQQSIYALLLQENAVTTNIEEIEKQIVPLYDSITILLQTKPDTSSENEMQLKAKMVLLDQTLEQLKAIQTNASNLITQEQSRPNQKIKLESQQNYLKKTINALTMKKSELEKIPLNPSRTIETKPNYTFWQKAFWSTVGTILIGTGLYYYIWKTSK